MTSLADLSLAAALEAIADRTPTPGGGAVAGATLGLAAATAAMVVNYSHGRKSLAEHESLHAAALTSLAETRTAALALAERDAEAYGALNALWKLPEDDPARQAGWTDAVAGAIAAPRALLEAAVEVRELMQSLEGTLNRNLMSDWTIARLLTRAAAEAAACNVRVNLPLLEDAVVRDELKSVVETALAGFEHST